MATTISLDKLNTPESLNLQSAPQDTTDYGAIINSAFGNPQELDNQRQGQETQTQSSLNTLNSLLQEGAGIGSQQLAMENQAGISQQQKEVQDLTNQLNSIRTQANVIPMQIQQESAGRGRTEAGIAPLQTAELRNNAIQALTVGAQLQAKQGNLALAQSQIERAIDLKYKDIENRTKLAELNYNRNKDVLEKIDKKRADALGYAIQKQKEKDAENRANETAIQNMIVEATPNAPASVISNARKLAESGASRLAVAQSLGVYGGDYLKNELLKSQLETDRAQRNKIYSDMAAKNTPITTIDGIISTLPKAQQDRYYKLQGDFDKATEKYRGAIDAAGSVKALSENATAQDQTAIIFQYMKTLDPTSTVREGEFALVAGTAGLGDRAVNALKRLDNGQRLNQQQISDIVGATEKLATNAKQNLSATAKEYDRRASLGGLPKGIFLSTEPVSLEDAYADDVLSKLEAASNYKPTPQTFLQALTGY